MYAGVCVCCLACGAARGGLKSPPRQTDRQVLTGVVPAADLLAGAEHVALFQIDDAVLAELIEHRSGVRVERDEPIAGRDVEHAIVSAAIGPVRDAAARQLSRSDAGAPPSRRLCAHISSPSLPSSATTDRRVPPVVYNTPSIISGVPSSLYSGRGPSMSVLNRQAISSVLQFDALI